MRLPWTKEQAVSALDELHAKYASVFTGPIGDDVLHDIANYTHALVGYRASTSEEQAFIEGGRAVFWRIFDYSRFGGEELFRLKARRLEEPTNG